MSVISSPRTQAQAALVHEAISILSPKWTLASLASLRRRDAVSYTQLREHLPQISSSAMSTRMSEMERHGLLTKSDENGPRDRILRLTPAGRDTDAISRAAVQWGAAHLTVRNDQPTSFLAERTLAAVSRPHTTAVIWELDNGHAFPSELYGVLPRHVTSTVLYHRLNALVASGLLAKVGEPGRWQYELTDAARELRTLYQAVSRWSRTHLGSGAPRTALATALAAAPFSSAADTAHPRRTAQQFPAAGLQFSHPHQQQPKPSGRILQGALAAPSR